MILKVPLIEHTPQFSSKTVLNKIALLNFVTSFLNKTNFFKKESDMLIFFITAAGCEREAFQDATGQQFFFNNKGKQYKGNTVSVIVHIV